MRNLAETDVEIKQPSADSTLSKVEGPLTSIHIAVEKRQLKILEDLLSNGADVNSRYPVDKDVYTGSTLLYRAASKGYEEVVEFLLEYGANVNAKNTDGSTSLHIAAEKGYLNIVKTLIAKGADVNVKHDLDSETDHYKGKFFENKIIGRFLNLDAVDVSNISVYEGEFTPLHVAIRKGHKEIVETLLESGADVNAHDDYEDTALALAALSGCLRMLELVLSYSPDKNNVYNKRALCYPVKFKGETYRNIIQKLLDYGLLIYDEGVLDYNELFFENVMENDHFFLIRQVFEIPTTHELDIGSLATYFLKVAIMIGNRGNVEEVKFLLDHGADVNVKNHYRYPLLNAIRVSNLELVKLLIERGAIVKEKPDLLFTAVKNGCIETVRILITNGADVNEGFLIKKEAYRFNSYLGKYKPLHNEGKIFPSNDFMISPLFIAASKGYEDVLKCLLDNEAQIGFQTCNDLTPFLVSVVCGHFKVAEILLMSGASINSTDFDGRTALHIAAELGHRDVVNLLLRFGANVDAVVNNQDVSTPLRFAAEFGHLDIVKTLLEYGANANFTNGANLSVLSHAAQNGHAAVVKLLLDHGANVNDRIRNQWTPLYYAASSGHTKTVETLLEYGASVNTYDEDWTSVLRMADSSKDEVVKLLLKYGAEANLRDLCQEGLLLFAVQAGETATVEAIIKKGLHINHPALVSQDLLSVAVKYGHLEMANLLFDSGVKFNSDEKRDHSFLTSADRGFLDVMEFMIHHGVNINVANRKGQTALHFAAEKGNVRMVKFLLEHKSNVNAVTEKGETPLILSAKIGCVTIADALIKSGADVQTADHHGKTALLFAVEQCYADLLKLLLECGANVNCKTKNDETPLLIAARRGHFRMLEPLIKFGANINMSDEDGETALYFVAEYGAVSAVKCLLENGANVNCAAKNGKTPLFISAERGRLESVDILLKFGADVSVTDQDGFTALNFAVEYGYHDIVKLLLEHGTDVCCKSRGDIPLLLMAAGSGHLQIVNFLMEFGATLDVTASPAIVEYLDDALIKWQNYETFYVLLENGPANVKIVSESTLSSLFDIISDFYWKPRLEPSDEISARAKCRNFAETLECFFIKMKAANILVNLQIEEVEPFNYRSFHTNFETICESELEIMRSEFISNSNVTFYDILTNSLHRLASLARNQSFLPFLMSQKYSRKFPIYCTIIRNQFRKGVLRRKLLDQGMKVFHSSPEVSSSLPFDVMERILVYLSNKELRILLLSFNVN